MQRWTKGPVCGVGNCPSRHWRVVNGQTVCRFGHVREGEIEIGEDDEYAGRVLTSTQQTGVVSQSASQHKSQIPELDANSRSRVLHGTELEVFRVRLYQQLLREQTQWLITEQKAPAQLEHAVKELWMVYMGETFKKKKSGRAATTRYSYVVSRLDAATCEGILALACRMVHTPIFMMDIIRWRKEWRLPVIDRLLRDPEVSQRLHQQPMTQPRLGASMIKVHMLETFFARVGVVIPAPNPVVLLTRLSIDLFLPPEILATALRIVQATANALRAGYSYHEVEAAAALSAAFYLACAPFEDQPPHEDDPRESSLMNRRIDQAEHPARLAMDFDLWRDLVRKVWTESASPTAFAEYDVEFWSRAKIDRYLSWYAANVTRSPPSDGAGIQAKIFDMFPLEGPFSRQFEVYPTSDTVWELGREMQSGVEWIDPLRQKGKYLYAFPKSATELHPTMQAMLGALGALLDFDVDKLRKATGTRVGKLFYLKLQAATTN